MPRKALLFAESLIKTTTMGIFNARRLKKKRQKAKWQNREYKKKQLNLYKRFNPLGGTSQARGIVVTKVEIEAKQPNSAMRKCCRVQLIKTGKQVTAFIPGNLAQKFIEEHDEVLIESIGGRKGRSKGDIPGVRYRIVKVNDQPLRLLVKGKIEKGRR